jgi:hypothetical protein
MSKRSKAMEILKQLTDIPEDCSDVESDSRSIGSFSLDSIDDFSNSDEYADCSDSDEESLFSEEQEESSNENENNTNKYKKKCLNISSESDEDEYNTTLFSRKEISADGTVWKRIELGGVAGRLSEEKKI